MVWAYTTIAHTRVYAGDADNTLGIEHNNVWTPLSKRFNMLISRININTAHNEWCIYSLRYSKQAPSLMTPTPKAHP